MPRQENYISYSTAAILTGLLPPIAHQLLLKGNPTSLERAVADARDIEFALDKMNMKMLMLSITKCYLPPQNNAQKSQSVLEQVTRRLELSSQNKVRNLKSN